MVKTIIHFADVHVRTYRMHDEYKEVFTQFINEVKLLTKHLKYDEIRIAIVGDLVHQKITISNEQLILCTWFLRELLKVGKVVIIAGNHDLLENNKDRVDSISPLILLLDNKNIAFYKESKCYEDDNIVWCNYSIFEGNKKPDIEKGRELYGNDKTYIGLYHAPLVGASTDIGYKFEEGTSLDIFNGCDMTLLGDIHKRDCFYLDEEMEIDEVELDGYIKKGWVQELNN
tara:strand:- start:854 stop:1540 length:687 start_codon:yes stop_codon:yes gene_type:complete